MHNKYQKGKQNRKALRERLCIDRNYRFTHSALVWLLSCVSTHMNHKHVLGFERTLFSGALLPVTHKLLLFSMDVFIIDVLLSKQSETKTDILKLVDAI